MVVKHTYGFYEIIRSCTKEEFLEFIEDFRMWLKSKGRIVNIPKIPNEDITMTCDDFVAGKFNITFHTESTHILTVRNDEAEEFVRDYYG
jgi:hypothetical protein